MSEFNENPFKKDTPVIPFSNGTEAMVYQEMNCHKCVHYESESKTEEEAKCKLAFHLEMGFILGKIPLYIAKEMGCDYNPLYGRVRLYKQCSKFNDGDSPF